MNPKKNKLINIIKKITKLKIAKKNIFVQWAASEKTPNFGDNITPYLLSKVNKLNAIRVGKHFKKTNYVMAGSIINRVNNKSIVFGTGIIRENDKIIERPKKVLAVRGPLTRRYLLSKGIDCPDVYGDPGLLLPVFYKPSVTKKFPIGLIPHYADKKVVSSIGADIKIIDVFNNVEEVVDEICSCDIVVSSSLHGIIIAHAYGIPALWVKLSDDLVGDGIKFLDYYNSVGIKNISPIEVKNHDIDFDLLTALIKKNSDRLLPEKEKIDVMLKKLLDVYPFKHLIPDLNL